MRHYDTTAAEQIRANSVGALITIAFAVTVAAVLFAGGFARAADMTKAPAPIRTPVVVTDSWSGFYLVGEVGYADAVLKFDQVGKLNPKAVSFGFGAGKNWRVGSFVGGIEIDGQWLQKSSSILVEGLTASAKFDMLGMARARLGYLIAEPLLVYGTAGFAVGHGHAGLALGKDSIEANAVSMGWVAGGGAEFRLSHNWSVRAQYLHVDLGKTSYAFSGEPVALSAKSTIDSAMLGVVLGF